jgi:hypothetical protein
MRYRAVIPKSLSPTLQSEGLIVPRRASVSTSRRGRGGGAPQLIPPTEKTISPLTDVFPQTRIIGMCGFQAMVWSPPGGSLDPALPVWHKLLDIEPFRIIGGECAFVAADFSLASTDCTVPAAHVDSHVWGGTIDGAAAVFATGAGAAIVIGENLPVSSGETDPTRFTQAPCSLPGVSAMNFGIGNNDQIFNNPQGNYFLYKFFPSGQFFSTGCQRAEARVPTSPYVYRYRAGRRIQVALVHNPQLTIGGGTSGTGTTIYGHAAIALVFGLVDNPVAYTARRNS